MDISHASSFVSSDGLHDSTENLVPEGHDDATEDSSREPTITTTTTPQTVAPTAPLPDIIEHFLSTKKDRRRSSNSTANYQTGSSNGSLPSTSTSRCHLIESTAEKDKQKRSLYTLYLTSLMGAIGYSSVMTSAYPYLLSLYPDTTTALYGWVIAMYSVGQLISSPTLGYLSQRISYRPLFVFTIALMIAGNLLYAYLSLFPKHLSGLMMLIARFILGFGAGNMTLIRTYASSVTSYEDRAVTMAWVTGTQALGFVIGPIIQTAFTPLKNGVTLHRIRLQFSMYTGPAFLAAIINTTNLIIFNINFYEIGRTYVGSSVQSATSIIRSKNFVSVVLCNILWFAFLFDFSFFETIMTPLVQAEFAWSYNKTVLYNGILLFCNAIMSTTIYLLTRKITKKFKEKHILAFSTLFLSLAFVLLCPFSRDYPKVALIDINKNDTSNDQQVLLSEPTIKEHHAKTFNQSQLTYTYFNHTEENINMTADVYRSSFESSGGLNSSVEDEDDNGDGYESEIIGCSTQVYPWCVSQHQILFVQFVLCSTVLSLTYPLGMVTITSLYSQAIDTSASQGIYQGILTSSGSLSRALGPVFVSNVFEKHGPKVVFPSITVMTFAIFCLVVVFNNRFGVPTH